MLTIEITYDGARYWARVVQWEAGMITRKDAPRILGRRFPSEDAAWAWAQGVAASWKEEDT
jgi:hypothetical protein